MATFSPCTRYRYTLRRNLVPLHSGDRRLAVWIMLNPSTADERVDDKTIEKVSRYSRRWGYQDLLVVNAFAWRSTDPHGLKSHECLAAGGPVGTDNDAAIIAACNASDLVVCAWGNHLTGPRRDRLVGLLINDIPDRYSHPPPTLTALKINKDGSPAHPLYLPDSLTPQPFAIGGP